MGANNQGSFYIDTADNLIRWDMFHVVNENIMDKYISNNEDNPHEVRLEACDLYLLHISDCDVNEGNKVLFCVADPKDRDVPNNILTMMMSIHPKEPMLVKRRTGYKEGTLDMIHLLDRKRSEAETEDEKSSIQHLIKKVGALIAKENGYEIEDKSDDNNE